ncbi:hypothetical protein [Biformimicrobium ophioploci]|uniref:hypothetical protein n=1 Tax=Biformimicrobium ophioploci TaxID=3036711 RepID=UPI0025532CBD|nr:hypothetical protein [Microbulbifer sp. NKW57]
MDYRRCKGWCASVGLAIPLLVPVVVSAEDRKPDNFGATFSLGQAIRTSDSAVAEIALRYDRWELGGTIFGHGDTKRGDQNRLGYGGSVSRLFKPGWKLWQGDLYGRLGVAYIEDSPLVGEFNFRSGFGIDFRHFQIEYNHYSSGKIYPINTGIDLIQLKVPFF